jgi:hypothetical protein
MKIETIILSKKNEVNQNLQLKVPPILLTMIRDAKPVMTFKFLKTNYAFLYNGPSKFTFRFESRWRSIGKKLVFRIAISAR